ncbi:3D domain-containing protein [Mucisphaera calidilacus]|uniref:Cell wall-binding protein YocH n=1 Tax=Mucisphaera calidilacus TaxID=2527982 RepID=A0A518BW94_9BACT|nr:3D domain-containing protein [Mucisphaera calidilacus]QDU71246.1 Cell wall-binding protein YocH precursor [Mucisphaera calidilacus]
MNPISQSTTPSDAAKLRRLRRRVRRTWQAVGLLIALAAGTGLGGLLGVFNRTSTDSSSLPLLSIDRLQITQNHDAGERDEPEVLEIIPVDSGALTTRFGGEELALLGEVEMTVTAYSPDERSCGPWNDGFTASGYSVWTNGMRLVAADTRLLPFGTVLTIPGYNDGQPVQVLDRGGAIKGHRLDVLFATHEAARAWGVRKIKIGVWGPTKQNP